MVHGKSDPDQKMIYSRPLATELIPNQPKQKPIHTIKILGNTAQVLLLTNILTRK